MSSQPVPPIAPSGLPRQSAVYRRYLLLQSLAATHHLSLPGSLVASSGMGREGTELAMAATIAGATFLGIDPSPQRLKAALRNSACDFMVNTLDEALRVLKNELRKHQPLSVGLLGNAAEILPQMVERGVQPDFLADTSPLDTPADYLVPASLRSNAKAADETNPGLTASRTSHREAMDHLAERGAIWMDWKSQEAPAAETCVIWRTQSLQDLKRLDALAISLLPPTDVVRRRWLERAGGYFHRQTPLERVVSFCDEEATALLEALKELAFCDALEFPVTLHWQNKEGESELFEIPARKTQTPS